MARSVLYGYVFSSVLCAAISLGTYYSVTSYFGQFLDTQVSQVNPLYVTSEDCLCYSLLLVL